MAQQGFNWMYAALGLGAVYLLTQKKSGNSIAPNGSTSNNSNYNTGTPGQVTSTNKPVAQVIAQLPPYNQANYDAIIYPQMLAIEPNLGNSNYTLTDAEAGQYLRNYLDLKQGTAAWFPGDPLRGARSHWQRYGVAEKRTFLPLNPPSLTPFVEAPPTGGGGSWVTDALGIAGSILGMIFGPDLKLSDKDVEIVVNSAYIIKQVLPFYAYVEPEGVQAINNRIDLLINEYV